MVSLLRRLIGLTAPRPAARARQWLVLEDEEAVVYAIGDIHGCMDELCELEELIADDARDARLKTMVILGDFIDRGPRSASVMRHLLEPPPPGFRRHVLLGNHEAAMLAFLDDPRRGAAWLDMGGRETLASYGVPMRLIHPRESRTRLAQSAQASIPGEHIAFLRRLPILILWRNYVFVHAGLRPGIPLERQNESALLEIREEFTGSRVDHGRIVVHGHTPAPLPHQHPNRIAVDTAAYATGRLAAVKLAGGNAGFLLTGRIKAAD